jgi:hypothetical protein
VNDRERREKARKRFIKAVMLVLKQNTMKFNLLSKQPARDKAVNAPVLNLKAPGLDAGGVPVSLARFSCYWTCMRAWIGSNGSEMSLSDIRQALEDAGSIGEKSFIVGYRNEAKAPSLSGGWMDVGGFCSTAHQPC